MRRPLRALSSALLATLALAAPAGASDHLMRINDILPDGAGGAQFVELLDSSPVELFPSPPYKLIVYSSSGAVVGKVPLPQAELATTGTSPYLVAHAAQGGTPDEPLSVALPASSGQSLLHPGRRRDEDPLRRLRPRPPHPRCGQLAACRPAV